MEFIFDGLGAGFAALYTVYSMVASSFGIALYVLRALGLYSIAKRRGINRPWMSWVPVLDLWVLGCISDQYQYVVNGNVRNKRKWLLGLSIAMAVLYIVFAVLIGVAVFGAVGGMTGSMSDNQLVATLLGPVMGLVVGLIPLVGIAIAVMVIRYVAMYDLYTSCNPQNNVLFLVLSIFFSVTEPFFLFFNRNKDGGMPPRKPDPQQPVYESQAEERDYL